MLYLPINKNWIESRVAQRIYFTCAVATLSLLGSLFAIRLAVLSAGLSFQSEVSAETVILVQILVWPGIIGAAVMWIAMWYFWLTFDSSGWLQKAVWFFFLLLFAPLAQLFYYFFVYRRVLSLKQSSIPTQ